MRWIWIDRFVEFESGRRARAIKNVTLAEDHLHDHFYGYPMMPNSLILEGLAQTGGILVGEQSKFEAKVVLAKVAKVVFHFPAVPGDTLVYTATVETFNSGGAKVSATSAINDRLQAEAEIMFAHLSDEQAGDLFDQKNFVFTMRLLGVFDVGRGQGGLPEPPGLTAYRASGALSNAEA
jgi:3-hydroxyacyl-[acyl-carrier-protein] dehydratase